MPRSALYQSSPLWIASHSQQTFHQMDPRRLCSRCQAIFNSDIDPNGSTIFDHYGDGDAFISMAETASCYICTWAWRRYRDIVGHREGQLSVHHTTVSFFARNGELSFMFFEVYETSRSSRTVAEFKPQRMDSGCKACSMLSWVCR